MNSCKGPKLFIAFLRIQIFIAFCKEIKNAHQSFAKYFSRTSGLKLETIKINRKNFQYKSSFFA